MEKLETLRTIAKGLLELGLDEVVLESKILYDIRDELMEKFNIEIKTIIIDPHSPSSYIDNGEIKLNNRERQKVYSDCFTFYGVKFYLVSSLK